MVELAAAGEAVGHPDAHHEFAWCGLAKENSHPLEQILLRVGQ
jgi:hypothetical protein